MICEEMIENSAIIRFPALPLSMDTAAGDSITAGPNTSQAAASDEVLLTRFAEGDQQALACLFERHGRLLRSIATRILRDGAEAEDLVQDLFLFIHRKSVIFDSRKSSARSWIVQMVYHRAISPRPTCSSVQ